MRTDWLTDHLVPRDPYQAAVRRLTRQLVVDRPVLHGLRRAARKGGGPELAAYGWALGLASDEVEAAGPLRSAEAFADAAEVSPDNAAVQFAVGLILAGSFGRRRGIPLEARRGFTNAARLDPDNALVHLLVAAVRFSDGDEPAAARALEQARAAAELRPYRSPLGRELEEAAPWLSQNLAVLWPERIAVAVRYVLTSLLNQARRATAAGEDPSGALDTLSALAELLVRASPRRPCDLLLAGEAVLVAMAARHEVLGDVQAADRRERAADALATMLDARRREAARFERAAQRLLLTSGGGAGTGLGVAGYGWWRSRRRWPPPFPMALPGRWIAALGGGLTLASLLLAIVPNSAAANWRRRVERRLVRIEGDLAGRAADTLAGILAELPG